MDNTVISGIPIVPSHSMYLFISSDIYYLYNLHSNSQNFEDKENGYKTIEDGSDQSRIHSLLRAPLHTRVHEISQLVEQIPFKDLQAVFPQIVGSIFGNGGASEDWGLRTITAQNNAYDFDNLCNFLVPRGPLFRICYKLIGDPQLKYVFPTRLLPLDVFQMLESGRLPQFYLDLLNVDPHTRQIISLNLNPFDYYIFHFASYLHNAPCTKGAWDSWNTVYYSLCCEYLLHFLPSDPNTPVLPHIAYFTGKTPAVSPMQTANRHSQFPSLLVSQDAVGSPGVSSSGGSQLHPRGEVWRSETVLQVFIDIWLSTSAQQAASTALQPTQVSTYPASEHVRIARSLIKQCHAFSLSGSSDVTSLGELRRATPALLSPRATRHIRHLMHSWPLDASFRLVLELWFSFIQPWRYVNLYDENPPNSHQERMDSSTEEVVRTTVIDATFIPFISENLLAYTEIFQLIVPRFLRLDLTAPKNAIMLFRLTKVFSQTNLVQLLTEIEKSVTLEMEPTTVNGNTSFLNQYPCSPAQSFVQPCSPGIFDRTANNIENSFNSCTQQMSQMASQSCNPGLGSAGRFTDAGTSQYCPLFLGAGRPMARDLMMHAQQANSQVTDIIQLREERLKAQRSGFFGAISYWLMGDSESSDELPLEELKKVPGYLRSSITQLAELFSLDASSQNGQLSRHSLNSSDPSYGNDNNLSRRNMAKFSSSLSPRESKERAKNLKYMGNPDIQPVKSYESGFLVHLLNQIASRLNETYCEEMRTLWCREDYIGVLTKEVLEAPCQIRSFCKSGPNYGALITETLPPRVCLRPLASHLYIFWFSVFCIISYLFGYSIPLFVAFCFTLWIIKVILKGTIHFWMGSRRGVRTRELAMDTNNSFDSTDDSARFMSREQAG